MCVTLASDPSVIGRPVIARGAAVDGSAIGMVSAEPRRPRRVESRQPIAVDHARRARERLLRSRGPDAKGLYSWSSDMAILARRCRCTRNAAITRAHGFSHPQSTSAYATSASLQSTVLVRGRWRGRLVQTTEESFFQRSGFDAQGRRASNSNACSRRSQTRAPAHRVRVRAAPRWQCRVFAS